MLRGMSSKKVDDERDVDSSSTESRIGFESKQKLE
jgi:hypothetical protein